MIGAALVIALVILAGAIPTAIALGWKAGTLKGDLTVAQDAGARAIAATELAEISAEERLRRKDLVIVDLKGRIRAIHDELDSMQSPAVRASVALSLVDSLLSEMQNVDDEDPSEDHDAGSVPSDDDATN